MLTRGVDVDTSCGKGALSVGVRKVRDDSMRKITPTPGTWYILQSGLVHIIIQSGFASIAMQISSTDLVDFAS